MDELAAASRALKALADPTRLRILHLLSKQELTVAELTRVLATGQSTVSQHLAQLRKAGLVADRRDGTRTYCSRVPGSGPAERAHAEIAPEIASSPEARADLSSLREVMAARAQEARAYFDRIADAIEHEYLPGRTWEGLAKALVRLLPRRRVADLGIGGGELTLLLCDSSEKVIGVDSSRAMLERVRAKAKRAGVRNLELRAGEIEALPLEDGEVDLAILSQVLHHAEEPPRALREAHRVVAPGGRVLVLDLVRHKAAWTREKFQDRWPGFRESELEELLAGAGFTRIATAIVAREREPPHFQTLMAVAERPDGAGGPAPARTKARRTR